MALKRADFVPKYRELVAEGKTAAEIGAEFGLTAAQVTAKASQLRMAVRKAAVRRAIDEGLKGDKATNFVTDQVAKIPKLENRTHSNILDEL